MPKTWMTPTMKPVYSISFPGVLKTEFCLHGSLSVRTLFFCKKWEKYNPPRANPCPIGIFQPQGWNQASCILHRRVISFHKYTFRDNEILCTFKVPAKFLVYILARLLNVVLIIWADNKLMKVTCNAPFIPGIIQSKHWSGLHAI